MSKYIKILLATAILFVSVGIAGVVVLLRNTSEPGMYLPSQPNLEEVKEKEEKVQIQKSEITVPLHQSKEILKTLEIDVANARLALNIPQKLRYVPKEKYIITPVKGVFSSTDRVVRVGGEFTYEKKKLPFYIFLKPRAGVSVGELQEKLKEFEIIEANPGYGIGSEVDSFKKENPSYVISNTSGMRMERLISDWGNDWSWDLLAYRVMLPDNELFDEMLVNFHNLSKDTNLGEELSNAQIQSLIDIDSPDAKLYSSLDYAMQYMVFQNTQ